MPSNPVALVTGAGRNIGRAVALALAAQGADVVLNVRSNRAEAERVADEVRSLGRRAFIGVGDVRDTETIREMVRRAREELGPVTILVNNAAIRKEAPFQQVSLEEWHEVLGVILDGAFGCSQAVIPQMIEAGWGRIINIAGMTGQSGAAERVHVVTGKAGLIGFTKALALEYADRNITVNAVSPGMIETTRAGSGAVAVPRHHSEVKIPVGRRGTPEEVASLVAYLASDAAAFITGQVLSINGGLYL